MSNLALIGDFHRATVYHDAAFHAFMDRFPSNKGWRNWKFRRVRMYAKAYNFGRLYGVRQLTVADIDRLRSFSVGP